MLMKLCRDGLLYALALYVFTGGYMDFDFNVTQWPAGLRRILAGTWLLVMFCLWGTYREQSRRTRARERRSAPPDE